MMPLPVQTDGGIIPLAAPTRPPMPIERVAEPAMIDFQDRLERARADLEPRDGAETLRASAEKLVASTFILPILAQMRESNQAEGAFAPGMAERRFGPILDQHIADRIVHSADFTLVDRVVAQLSAEKATP